MNRCQKVIYSKYFKLKFILLFFLIIGQSQFALSKDIGFVIWINDNDAFSHKAYQKSMDELSNLNPANLIYYSIFTNGAQLENDLQIAIDKIPKEDKIVILVLADHGNTNRRKNLTTFRKLGGFGKDGAFGKLSHIITTIGEMNLFSENLHLFLDSCSTFCGSTQNLKIRNLGLSKNFNKYGVQNFSVWGARQPLITTVLRDKNIIEKYLYSQKKILTLVAPFVIPFMAGYPVSSYVEPEKIEMIRVVQNYLFNSFSILWGYGTLMHSLSFIISGTNGYHISINNDSPDNIKINEIDERSRSARLGMRCEQIFYFN